MLDFFLLIVFNFWYDLFFIIIVFWGVWVIMSVGLVSCMFEGYFGVWLILLNWIGIVGSWFLWLIWGLFCWEKELYLEIIGVIEFEVCGWIVYDLLMLLDEGVIICVVGIWWIVCCWFKLMVFVCCLFMLFSVVERVFVVNECDFFCVLLFCCWLYIWFFIVFEVKIFCYFIVGFFVFFFRL